MERMFYAASKFNQPLSLDTSSVTSMAYMFEVRAFAPNLQPALPWMRLAPQPPTALPPQPTPHPAPLRLGRARGSSTSR